MKTKNKLTTSILATTMLLGGMFTMTEGKVNAESNTKKTLMLAERGLGNIENPIYTADTTDAWQGSYLYWGEDASNPIKWQILNKEETKFSGSKTMLLLSAQTFGKTAFGTDANYIGSTLATLMNTLYTNKLTTKEQNATTTSSNSSANQIFFNDWFTDSAFPSNAKWFAPTLGMLSAEKYGFPNSNVLGEKSRATSDNQSYWLSAYSTMNSLSQPLLVISMITSWKADDATLASARSATNLDTDSILMVSDATGGKDGDSVIDANLANVNTSTSTEYKLTLKDNTQSISLSNVERKKDKMTFDFSKTGDGTYVSAVITDATGKEIISYDRIKNVGAGSQTGNASVTLPNDFDTNNYKLQVFTEDYKGDKATDYASELVEVTPTKLFIPFEYKDASGNVKRTVTEYALNDTVVYPTLDKIEGYRFDKWVHSSSDAVVDGKVKRFFSATASYIETYTYEYQDEDGNALLTETVDTGTDISKKAPVAPLKDGYTFDRWEYSVTDITLESLNKSFTAKAVYKLNASTPEDKPGNKPIIKPEEPTTPENKPNEITPTPDISKDTVKTGDQTSVIMSTMLLLITGAVLLIMTKKYSKQ